MSGGRLCVRYGSLSVLLIFFFSSRRRHTRFSRDWSSDVCSSDLTFEIHGITGGFTGDGAKTVIPAEATAKVSLRLVPAQKLKVVERQLAAAVRRFAPKHVQASVKFLHGADPATVKVTHRAFQLLDQAFREGVGRGTAPARAGGSIPVGPPLGQGGPPVT